MIVKRNNLLHQVVIYSIKVRNQITNIKKRILVGFVYSARNIRTVCNDRGKIHLF
jgi:hypothetical protein